MKTKIKLLVILLLLVACQYQEVDNKTTPVEKPISPSDIHEVVVPKIEVSYDIVGSNELVKEIAKAFYNHEPSIDFTDKGLSYEEIFYSANEAVTQNPMLLMIPNFQTEAQSFVLDIQYPVTKEEVERKRQEVWNVVTDFVQNPELKTMTDYEKSKIVYDYIITHSIYDYDSANVIEGWVEDQSQYDYDSSTAYGALIKQTAICSGFAGAYTILARAVGLESYVIEGNLLDAGYQPHAWNKTKLGDQFVVTDVTWGNANGIDYAYLNRPMKLFEGKREENIYANRHDLGTWPSIETEEYTYYVQNNLVYNAASAKDFILQQIEKKSDTIYLMLSDNSENELFQWFIDEGLMEQYPASLFHEGTIRITK